MGALLASLGDLGYGYAYRVLDACWFGLAQRRKRVFIVGHLGAPWTAPAEVLFEPEGCFGDTPPRREEGTLAPTILASGAGTDRPGGPRLGQEDEYLVPMPDVAHALTAYGPRMDPSTDTYAPFPTLRGLGHGWQGQHWDDASRTGLLRRLTPTECERLQGFPDGWTAYGIDADGGVVMMSDTQRYRMLGDAVPVPVAEWIFRRILKCTT
jgi:DNA (cytosine-5)-methyltransferase 1